MLKNTHSLPGLHPGLFIFKPFRLEKYGLWALNKFIVKPGELKFKPANALVVNPGILTLKGFNMNNRGSQPTETQCPPGPRTLKGLNIIVLLGCFKILTINKLSLTKCAYFFESLIKTGFQIYQMQQNFCLCPTGKGHHCPTFRMFQNIDN